MRIDRTTRRTGGSYGVRARSSAGYPREAQPGYRREAAQAAYRRDPGANGNGRPAVPRPVSRRLKSPIRLLFIGAACVVALVAVILAIASKPGGNGGTPIGDPSLDRITKGVRINGKDVSGKHVDELGRQLKAELLARVDEIDVTVTYGDKSWQLSGKDLSVTNNVDEVLGQAARLAHVGTAEQMREEARQIREEGRDFTVETTFDRKALELTLNGFANEINLPGSDAKPLFNYLRGDFADLDHPTREEIARMFTITPEKQGLSVDVDMTAQKILDAIRDTPKCSVEMVVSPFVPQITEEKLKESFQYFSYCSTYVPTTSTADRVKNIKRALALINGITLLPGEEFSFNQKVGPRTEANDFYVAPTISGGKYVDDYGGGVCQVSTTLYIAALRAGCKVTERHKHTYPSEYVMDGADATVAYDTKDLKFVNTSDLPIYIYTRYTAKRNAYVLIFGKPLPDGQYYKLKQEVLFRGELPQTIENVDTAGKYTSPSKPEFWERKPHEKQDINIYRLLMDRNGNQIGSPELITEDHYIEAEGLKWVWPASLFTPTPVPVATPGGP